MPTIKKLCAWLRHNVDDLRLAPDMVTEAAGPTVRFRWHGLVEFDGVGRGLGVDLHPGPRIGDVWLYGHGAAQLRLRPGEVPQLLSATMTRLRAILLAHVGDRERDWGRGHGLFLLPGWDAIPRVPADGGRW